MFKALFTLNCILMVYILIDALRRNRFFYCAMTIYIPFICFSNQIELDLKSINQEFLLFPKLLKKHPNLIN